MTTDNLLAELTDRGVSRRDFLKFCSAMAAVLGLSSSFVPQIAHALETKKKPILVWLECQSCTGDTEALLRASKPTVSELVLDILSLDYSETIMAAAGKQAEKSLADVLKNQKGKYFAAVEGSIPLKENGAYCCVGGRSSVDMVREVCGGAIATFAMGTCATFGGIPKAHPNPTGAVGVKDVVPGATVINLAGCPVNAENITAALVHYLAFGVLPAVDALGRPLFAYGKRIHDNCERRSHFDAGQYVRQWGDEGHRRGWCLYYMGCKGPAAYQNCPTVKYNERTSWPVQSGHGCIACAAPNFWDDMTPFYRRLPQPFGITVETTADKVGLAVTSATVGGILIHTIARLLRRKNKPKEESKAQPKTDWKGPEWHE
jgi:hydrogenase small subunit